MLVVLVAAGCGTTKTVTQTVTHTVTKTIIEGGACKGSDLTASFDAIPGSEGAGNIVYLLKIANSSPSSCTLTITNFQLLASSGANNPTNITPPGPATLAAGGSVTYNARFSPDVTGTGDNTTAGSQCQPTSATLRINGSLDAPIAPPTPVCEKGSMTLTSG